MRPMPLVVVARLRPLPARRIGRRPEGATEHRTLAPAPARSAELPRIVVGDAHGGHLDAGPTDQERDDRADQEHDEEDLGDAGRTGGDATEAEHRGDDRDDEEYDGVVKHGSLRSRRASCTLVRTLAAHAAVGIGAEAEAGVGQWLRAADDIPTRAHLCSRQKLPDIACAYCTAAS